MLVGGGGGQVSHGKEKPTLTTCEASQRIEFLLNTLKTGLWKGLFREGRADASKFGFAGWCFKPPPRRVSGGGTSAWLFKRP